MCRRETQCFSGRKSGSLNRLLRSRELHRQDPKQNPTISSTRWRELSRDPPYSLRWRRAFEDIVNQTAHRLRNFLHQGKLKAYYFEHDGCHSVSRELLGYGAVPTG